MQAGPDGATQHEGQGLDQSHRLQLLDGPRKGIFRKGDASLPPTATSRAAVGSILAKPMVFLSPLWGRGLWMLGTDMETGKTADVFHAEIK